MPQREYACLGEQIAAEAWDAFDAFCRSHDPEGNMETIDLVAAYAEHCDKNPTFPKLSNGEET